MILQTTKDIKNMKNQLDELLKSNSDNSNVDTYADYDYQEPKYYQGTSDQLSGNQQNNALEYRLQQFKKRNGFNRPTKRSQH